MAMAEIRRRLGGISRQQVYELTARDDFPEPYDELTVGKLWLRADVERWIRQQWAPACLEVTASM
jgi:predicted DNA-binding transcriptional regulator AlpA